MSKEIIGVDLKLDPNYIKGAVQEIVSAAIIEALGDPGEVVKMAIEKTIETYVDLNGKPTQKGNYMARPYLEWLASHTITETVREAMREVVEENADQFKAEIKSQMSKKKFREKMQTAFIDTIVNASTADWRMPITITFDQKESY